MPFKVDKLAVVSFHRPEIVARQSNSARDQVKREIPDGLRINPRHQSVVNVARLRPSNRFLGVNEVRQALSALPALDGDATMAGARDAAVAFGNSLDRSRPGVLMLAETHDNPLAMQSWATVLREVADRVPRGPAPHLLVEMDIPTLDTLMPYVDAWRERLRLGDVPDWSAAPPGKVDTRYAALLAIAIESGYDLHAMDEGRFHDDRDAHHAQALSEHSRAPDSLTLVLGGISHLEAWQRVLGGRPDVPHVATIAVLPELIIRDDQPTTTIRGFSHVLAGQGMTVIRSADAQHARVRSMASAP